ncbi:hypothetical protein ACFQVD_44785 [Streptosporangium amethystogenes subsp. fukuiense]|uniref:Uncharacterized protein n=1 Tax=Streptosporangium amethystogenes subsp. fukuiense TaxID=698418 RepID=A0ABW2TFS2_9ACTN
MPKIVPIDPGETSFDQLATDTRRAALRAMTYAPGQESQAMRDTYDRQAGGSK